jgi:hypothetical protein
VVEAGAIFPVSQEHRAAFDSLQRQADAQLGRNDRAAVEEIEDRGDRRYLVHNFRRASSASPKKILL